jgi:Arc/MetJ-type ribon-helix-helix transcriptional regulator
MATKETKKTVVQTEIPDRLLVQAQTLVAAGWFRDLNELMLDALRRFLESHRADMMEAFIRQDVEWGLSGKEVHSGPEKFDEEINS